MKDVIIIYGTRPEEIKVYPFVKYGLKFLQVNQSKDLHQGIIKPDFTCEENQLKASIKDLKTDLVIVQGDTRTAFYGALHAFELGIPVVHVEAGLRTFDLSQPFPEEGYRQMIDQIATYKFCSTEEAVKNCNGIYVGQTGIDTLFEFCGEIKDEGYWIVTVHRNEADMPSIIKQLKIHNKDKKLVIFAHPNQQGQELKKHFPCETPKNYKEFVKLLAKCSGVITDSGGLQEEAIALGKQVICLRDKSERGHGETYDPGATQKIVEVLNESL